jgi:hypothetical protein
MGAALTNDEDLAGTGRRRMIKPRTRGRSRAINSRYEASGYRGTRYGPLPSIRALWWSIRADSVVWYACVEETTAGENEYSKIMSLRRGRTAVRMGCRLDQATQHSDANRVEPGMVTLPSQKENRAMAPSDELDSPIFLGPDDWREIATAIESMIFDLEQRYGGMMDESLLTYRAMLLGLQARIGHEGRHAASRGTRWF